MADSELAIRAEGLTKLYGSDRGVLELDFSVAAGEVFGFLGPNGAGKTTTIRLILDLIRPTQLNARITGDSSDATAGSTMQALSYTS